MKKIVILILSFIALNAQPATKEDIKELRQDIKLLINKVNEIDKKVYANSIKIDMLEKNMNKRFEQVDKKFDDMNKRFEDMLNYLWMISTAFLGLTAVTIGFAIWDRKSAIKAVKDEIVEDIKINKLKEFVYELKKLAKEDKELAKVLRSFHIL
jgi:hypothetical protein